MIDISGFYRLQLFDIILFSGRKLLGDRLSLDRPIG